MMRNCLFLVAIVLTTFSQRVSANDCPEVMQKVAALAKPPVNLLELPEKKILKKNVPPKATLTPQQAALEKARLINELIEVNVESSVAMITLKTRYERGKKNIVLTVCEDLINNLFVSVSNDFDIKKCISVAEGRYNVAVSKLLNVDVTLVDKTEWPNNIEKSDSEFNTRAEVMAKNSGMRNTDILLRIVRINSSLAHSSQLMASIGVASVFDEYYSHFKSEKKINEKAEPKTTLGDRGMSQLIKMENDIGAVGYVVKSEKEGQVDFVSLKKNTCEIESVVRFSSQSSKAYEYISAGTCQIAPEIIDEFIHSKNGKNAKGENIFNVHPRRMTEAFKDKSPAFSDISIYGRATNIQNACFEYGFITKKVEEVGETSDPISKKAQ